MMSMQDEEEEIQADEKTSIRSRAYASGRKAAAK